MRTPLPFGKFFWSDYASDPALKVCGFGAQGLWMRMLCIAAEHNPVGYVAINGKKLDAAAIARVCGGSVDEVSALLSELESNGVFSRDRRGWIYSRRMVRDAKKRADAKKHGSEGGNPKLKALYNKPGFIYLIGPRSDGAYKIGISTNPRLRLKKIRAQYRGQDLELIDQWQCDDMGSTEADLHAKFEDKRSGEWFFLKEPDLCKLRTICKTLKGSEKGQPKPHIPYSRNQNPEVSTSEVENNLKSRENAADAATASYAFFGQTIKLAPRHFEEWKRLFHTILDLHAELSVLDGWWQTQSPEKRDNWFIATKGMLNKRHQQNLAIEKHAQAPPIWDGMP